MEAVCAHRPYALRQAEGATRIRRLVQAAVSGLLVVAVAVFVLATSGPAPSAQGSPARTALYAWTNQNDRSRGFQSSVISGMDADDPAFSPARSRVPPVDRVIARLKGKYDPEFYDAEHHGRNAQYVTGAPPPPPGRYHDDIGEPEALSETSSGTSFVVDPAATDASQFNINLLLRKSGRMGRDAEELAELQGEDQQLTEQYDYASKRAASLLALEGDMKDELQELSQKQLSIVAEMQNMTANETAQTEAIESDFVGQTGGEEAASEQGVEPEADPEAPPMPSIDDDGGAAEKERGRAPMLARREPPRLAPRHFPARTGAPRFRGESVHVDTARSGARRGAGKGGTRTRPAGRRVGERMLTGGLKEARRDESVAAQVSRAGLRAEKSAAKMGTLLQAAKRDVVGQAAAAARREHAEEGGHRPSLEAIIGEKQYTALRQTQGVTRAERRGAP